MKENVVLTGLPRGGTTLTCYLLNKLPDTVALHEPVPPARSTGLGVSKVLENAEKFHAKIRRMIGRRGIAFSKCIRGPVTNYAYSADLEEASGKTKPNRKDKKVPVDKKLSDNFLFAIKSPGRFSALLPVLTERFSCYAVVRNPLPVLSSWDSYDRSTRAGRQPAAERYYGELELVDVYRRPH